MVKVLPIDLKVKMSSEFDPCKASCGCEVDAIVSFHLGEVVAIPRLPVKKESVVVVEMRLPTVNCVPVAMRLPEELVVTIELIGRAVIPSEPAEMERPVPTEIGI